LEGRDGSSWRRRGAWLSWFPGRLQIHPRLTFVCLSVGLSLHLRHLGWREGLGTGGISCLWSLGACRDSPERGNGVAGFGIGMTVSDLGRWVRWLGSVWWPVWDRAYR
jgi:hypothetical protein